MQECLNRGCYTILQLLHYQPVVTYTYHLGYRHVACMGLAGIYGNDSPQLNGGQTVSKWHFIKHVTGVGLEWGVSRD